MNRLFNAVIVLFVPLVLTMVFMLVIAGFIAFLTPATLTNITTHGMFWIISIITWVVLMFYIGDNL